MQGIVVTCFNAHLVSLCLAQWANIRPRSTTSFLLFEGYHGKTFFFPCQGIDWKYLGPALSGSPKCKEWDRKLMMVSILLGIYWLDRKGTHHRRRSMSACQFPNLLVASCMTSPGCRRTLFPHQNLNSVKYKTFMTSWEVLFLYHCF